jgi:hypothetical protein
MAETRERALEAALTECLDQLHGLNPVAVRARAVLEASSLPAGAASPPGPYSPVTMSEGDLAIRDHEMREAGRIAGLEEAARMAYFDEDVPAAFALRLRDLVARAPASAAPPPPGMAREPVPADDLASRARPGTEPVTTTPPPRGAQEGGTLPAPAAPPAKDTPREKP